MITLSSQVELDLIQAAHYRVCADTRLLKKRATLTLPADSLTLALPDEVLRLEGLYAGDLSQINPTTYVDYLKLRSGTALVGEAAQMVFCVIGRTLHIWPASGAEQTLTAFYSYRPQPLDSSSSLEVAGQAERLVERLASAYALLDDGQPELAQTELAEYYKDASRLRHQDRRSEGMTGQIAVLGRTRRG